MGTNWKQKLTSRKFWAAIVSFVALLVVALGGTEAQATQITALIMAGATVVAYIIGEGMIDAASAGATVNITGNPTITGVGDTPTAGQEATTPDSAPVVGTAETVAPESAPTGTAQAAEVKQDTALSSTPTMTQPAAGSEVTAPATPSIDPVASALQETLKQVTNAMAAANAAVPTPQTAVQPESGAVTSGTTGTV